MSLAALLPLLSQGRCAIFTVRLAARSISVSFLNLYVGSFDNYFLESNRFVDGLSFHSGSTYARVGENPTSEDLYNLIMQNSRSNFGVYFPHVYVPCALAAAPEVDEYLANLRAPTYALFDRPRILLGRKLNLTEYDDTYSEEEQFARTHMQIIDCIWDNLPIPIAEVIAEEFSYDFEILDDVMTVNVSNDEVTVVGVWSTRIDDWDKLAAEFIPANLADPKIAEKWFARLCRYRVRGWRPKPLRNPFADYAAQMEAYARQYPLSSQLLALVYDGIKIDYNAVEAHLRACGWYA